MKNELINRQNANNDGEAFDKDNLFQAKTSVKWILVFRHQWNVNNKVDNNTSYFLFTKIIASIENATTMPREGEKKSTHIVQTMFSSNKQEWDTLAVSILHRLQLSFSFTTRGLADRINHSHLKTWKTQHFEHVYYGVA